MTTRTFLTHPIPRKIWLKGLILFSVWLIGTEHPYADRFAVGWTINWFCEQAKISLSKETDSYDRRYRIAWRQLNPQKPCISCWLNTHKYQMTRKAALEKEAKLRKYKEDYKKALITGVYPLN